MSRLTKAMRQRFEFGEIERDISRERQMVPPGSIIDRMFGWLQDRAREGREEAHEQVMEEAGRAALASHRQENEGHG